jgi:hypothetical protein
MAIDAHDLQLKMAADVREPMGDLFHAITLCTRN